MKKITYAPPPSIGEKLRENVADTGRTASDLIDSALAFYFDAAPKEYHDKAPRPLPMYFMLSHPDGHFYDVGVGENAVSGLFEGTARDFSGQYHTLTGIEWEVSIESFFDAAYRAGIIADHNNAYVWPSDADDAKQYPRDLWAAHWIDENVATELFYKVLAAAYRAEWENEMAILAERFRDLTALGKFQPARLWDADLKTAVLELAGLFRACEGWPIQGI